MAKSENEPCEPATDRRNQQRAERRRELPIEGSLIATALLCVLLFAIVRWKDRLMAGVTLTGPLRIFEPILK